MQRSCFFLETKNIRGYFVGLKQFLTVYSGDRQKAYAVASADEDGLQRVKPLFPVSYIDMFNIILPRLSFVDLEIKRPDKRSKLGKSKIPRIKIRLFFQYKVTHISKVCPSIIVGQVGY